MIKFKVVVCVCLVHFFTISIVQCAKSITKRSLFFPFTTILQFNYGLSVPITIDGAPGGTTIVLSLCFQGNFDLPKMTSDVKIHNLAKRDIEDNDISKLEFYYYVVQYLESLDLNGEECLLRMICEIAKYPMDKDSDDTVIEKVAHFLFTPSTRTDEIDNEINNPYLTDLLEAEEVGKRCGHCKSRYNLCEVSLASIFSKFFII